MSGDLSMTLMYDDKPPRWRRGEGVLFAAKQMLKILHEIDRAQNGKASIVWDVNIYSFSDRGVIEFSAAGRDSRIAARAIGEAAIPRAAEVKPPRVRR